MDLYGPRFAGYHTSCSPTKATAKETTTTVGFVVTVVNVGYLVVALVMQPSIRL